MRQARAGHDTCGQRVTPRCRWAAGPGRTTSRRAERSSRRGRLTGGSPPTGTHSDQAPQVWRAPEGPEGTGGLRDNAPRHTPACQSPPMWRGAGGSGGHGRASRSTTPIRRLACGDLAGGRARRRPEHPWGHKQHKQEGRRPRAHQAARPNNTPRGARNASGATRNTAQGRGPTGPRP